MDNSLIRVNREGTCPSLSGRSKLTYEVGADPAAEVHLRIAKNTGTGYFNRDWVAWDAIRAVLEKNVGKPITLHTLTPLFKGTSANNAGGSPEAQAATHSTRFFDKIIELNLSAAFYCAQAANARMQAQPEGGSIVNIASVSATRASPGTAAYGAAKAGLLNLTQSLAMEWGPKVRVNAIIAGLVATGNAEAHYGGPAGLARVGASLPARRMGEPADIADACVYLASSLAAYVSGAARAVHGGGERPSFLDLAQASAGTNNLEHKHE